MAKCAPPQTATAKTRCDVVRSFLTGSFCYRCNPCRPKDGAGCDSSPCSAACSRGCLADPTQAGCSNTCYDCAVSAAPGYCLVGSQGLAARYDQAFNDKYNPGGFLTADRRQVREKELQIDPAAESALLSSLQREFPNVPASQLGSSWFDISNCKINADGSPGGHDLTRYPTRNDLVLLGYQPNPIIGTTALSGKVPQWSLPLIPIWMDRMMQPELAVVVIFVFLVIIFAAIIYSAYRWAKGAPTRSAIARNKMLIASEDTDQYRGTAFPSWPDPYKKVRQYIEAQERTGYDMSQWRKKYSLPPKD
jgi:hypothetical protein